MGSSVTFLRPEKPPSRVLNTNEVITGVRLLECYIKIIKNNALLIVIPFVKKNSVLKIVL